MYVTQVGREFYIKTEVGPVPKHLAGAWTSEYKAKEALQNYQAQVRARMESLAAYAYQKNVRFKRAKKLRESNASSNAAATS